MIDLFCSEITQNVLEQGEKKAEMCGDRWKDQTLVLLLIYTSVLTTSLASKDE